MSEVAKKKTAEVVKIDQSIFEVDAGLGNSEVDSEVLSIPFLKTNLSNTIQEENRGCLKGDLYNTVDGQIYDGKKGILVIPCHFQRRWIQWSPIDDDQRAPIAIFEKASDCPPTERLKKDEKDNKDYLLDGSGHYVEETHQHYVLICKDDGTLDAVMIAMKSTSLKASRNWNALIKTRRFPKSDGTSFNPPRFSHIYRLNTVMQSNGTMSYAVWNAKLEKQVSNINAYNEAKMFQQSIQKGEVEVKHEQEEQASKPKPQPQPQTKVEEEPLQKDIPF
jgi:hypothetical protein|tara:strand:+ start:41 stop:871 length:831 start_codon:yes stop_codon:yes gene_type:complete